MPSTYPDHFVNDGDGSSPIPSGYGSSNLDLQSRASTCFCFENVAINLGYRNTQSVSCVQPDIISAH
ncbi:hypothetical protein Plhal304r1_c008g0032601 [Plasmopara halstedii]